MDFPALNDVQPGDPDPIGGTVRRCRARWMGEDGTTEYRCNRQAHRTGQHIAGDGWYVLSTSPRR